MDPIKIAICDDEKEIRGDLERRTARILPGAVIRTFPSGEALCREQTPFDVLLLDIGMPEENGMQIAARVRREERADILIFITGYEEYMPQAFDVQAFHYLIKPVGEEKLRAVLKKAAEAVRKRREQTRRFVLLKADGMSRKVFLEDITYIESNNKKVNVHLLDGSALETYRKMEEMENLLGSAFYRCHRGYLVNMKHITGYNAEEISLTGGGTILIAHRKYADFLKAFLRYSRGADGHGAD